MKQRAVQVCMPVVDTARHCNTFVLLLSSSRACLRPKGDLCANEMRRDILEGMNHNTYRKEEVEVVWACD
jgi:hypothetical protein